MFRGTKFPLFFHGYDQRYEGSAPADAFRGRKLQDKHVGTVDRENIRRRTLLGEGAAASAAGRFISMYPRPAEPLCFLHFNGKAKAYPSFKEATAFFGVDDWDSPPHGYR